jgi:superfamily I DNA/RNA helicase
MTPTPEQAEIYSHANSPQDLLVVALAGTGKTTTIEGLCSRMDPNKSILALAFNVKIKEELTKRLPSSTKCLTLNGLGNLAWKNQIGKFPTIDTKKIYNIIDEVSDLQGIHFTREEKTELKTLVDAARSLGWVPKGLPMQSSPTLRDEEHMEIFDWADVDYSEQLLVGLRAVLSRSITQAYSGTIDFTDQIYLPVVFRAPVPKYHTVIIDEAQDLSLLNHRLILAACKDRLIAVGDPNQAIYGFRGASATSIDDLRQQRDFLELPLTVTFRCAKAIVERQQAYVPEYKAAESNPQGAVHDWTIPLSDGFPQPWQASSLPSNSAVICRNNGPLLSLAFKLIRAGRPCTMLGRDIGLALQRKLAKACTGLSPSTPQADVFQALKRWRERELAKAKTENKKLSVEDSFECLMVIAEGVQTLGQAKKFCEDLFADKANAVTLSSGHKAKGLEWETVIHLDSFRVPSKYARTQEQLTQEYNIKYVIETRAKRELILANLEDFQ